MRATIPHCYCDYMKTIDLSYARTRIAYDPFTGVFTWKAKPVRKSQDAGWNTRFAGTVAGRTRPDGYVVISIDGVLHGTYANSSLIKRGA